MSMMDSLIDNPALLDNWIYHARVLPDGETRLDVPTLSVSRATIAGHLQAMDSLSSDRRIRYLAEHGFADVDIRELLSAIQQIITRDYGATIRQMVNEHARQGNGLADVIADVSNTNIIHDLATVCYRNADETAVVAAAYANHEFYYIVNAALNVAKIAQEQDKYDAASDPQCVERDQLLADVGLTEDARLWPES